MSVDDKNERIYKVSHHCIKRSHPKVAYRWNSVELSFVNGHRYDLLEENIHCRESKCLGLVVEQDLLEYQAVLLQQ